MFAQRGATLTELKKINKFTPLRNAESEAQKTPESDHISEDPSSKLAVFNKVNPKEAKPGETWPMLVNKGFGLFNKVSIVKNARTTGREVRCNCDRFQVDMTCLESKKFGLYCEDIYPQHNEIELKGPGKESDLTKSRGRKIDELCNHYKVEVELCDEDDVRFQKSAPLKDPQVSYRNCPAPEIVLSPASNNNDEPIGLPINARMDYAINRESTTEQNAAGIQCNDQFHSNNHAVGNSFRNVNTIQGPRQFGKEGSSCHIGDGRNYNPAGGWYNNNQQLAIGHQNVSFHNNNLQGFHNPQIENAPSIHNYNRDYLNWSYGGNNIEK